MKKILTTRNALFSDEIKGTQTYKRISLGNCKDDFEKELKELCIEVDIYCSEINESCLSSHSKNFCGYSELCIKKKDLYNKKLTRIVELVNMIDWE